MINTKVIKNYLVYVVSAIIMAVITPINIYAETNPIYRDYELHYYSGESVACSEGLLNGNDNLEKIYNFMLGKGLDDIHAAGVVGNIAVESAGAVDPFIVERNNSHPELPKSTQDPGSLPSIGGWIDGRVRQPGWGLIQWTPASKFVDKAEELGLSPPYDLDKQLQVIWWHMTELTPLSISGFLERYKATTTVEDATRLYMKEMEGPYGDGHIQERINAAKVALEYTKNPSVRSGCETGNSGAVSGDVIQTALNYAHPEYHPPQFYELVPAYAAAVKKAQQEGKYVGGGMHPGVDCGGFVTRVMQDSGADPSYGGGGNVRTQYTYLRESPLYIEVDLDGTNPDGTRGVLPGDIAIKKDLSHTYMYVGKQPNFETEIASASFGYNRSNGPWRSPMAGYELPNDRTYYWFRLVSEG